MLVTSNIGIGALAMAERLNGEGLCIRPQVGARPASVLMTLEGTLNPMRRFPSYKKIRDLPFDEQRERIDFRARILTGPFIEPELAQRFRAQAESLPVEIDEFIPSTASLYRQAEVVVSTAGYNTTTDVLTHARGSVIIPRVLHRQEQLVRARRLEELGLTICLPPDEVTPESLLEAIERVRGGNAGALAENRAQGRVPLDGARRFAEFCGGLEVQAYETGDD